MTESGRRPNLDRAERRYRRLLMVYPRAFRERFGRDAAEVFRDRYREAFRAGGGLRVAALWLTTAADVVVHGLRERFGRLGWPRAGRLGAEFVHAFQGTWRSRRLNLAAIACIALGVSAVGAVLTLYASVVLRPLPFPEHDRLVRVWNDDRGVDRRTQLSYPDVVDLRDQITTFDAFAATSRSRLMFFMERGARRVEGEGVTPGYFELLGVEPMLGRAFSPEDHQRAASPTMILAFSTWSSAYGADPDILGSVVRTATGTYTVIGVMPPSFLGTIEEDFPDIEFWVPMEHDITDAERERRAQWFIWTVGRLAPGTTLSQAQAEVAELGARWAAIYPDQRGNLTLRVEPMGENWREAARRQNTLLLAAAGLLLLVAAANVAGLLVARTLNRTRELAVRTALGASRGQIARLMLVETTALTIVGSAIGLLAAPSLLSGFLQLSPQEIPGYVAVRPDLTFLLLALGVVAVTSLVAGTVPALLGARTSPGEALRGSGRGNSASRSERRWGRRLVAAEVALTTVLVVTAGLLMRSLHAMSAEDLGYRTEQLLRLAIFVDQRDVERMEAMPAFHQRLREALTSHPGVRRVGLLWPALPPGYGSISRMRFPGMSDDQREYGMPVALHSMDPDFLPTMEMAVVGGRNLTSADDADGRLVGLVSESVARAMGGVETAIGRSFELGGSQYEIVGVVEDVMWEGPVRRRERDADVYVAMDQHPQRVISIAVHTAGDPTDLITPLRNRLLEIAPNSAHDWINPMTTEMALQFRSPRFYVVLLGAFAASALLLTVVGLFAVLANQVVRNTRDIGIRQALGAEPREVVRDVVGSGIVVTATGLLVGGFAAVVAVRGIRAMLYGVGPMDFVTWGVTAIVLLAAAGVASYVPALRASRINPVEALGGE